MSNRDWKKQLSEQQYHILREKGTDPPFSGRYVDHHENGTYTCAACGMPLFDSQTKFESGSGWPSFYDVLSQNNIRLVADLSSNLDRIEVICASCGGHLGHLFNDGPPDKTGQRYCINSTSLGFKPKSDQAPRR